MSCEKGNKRKKDLGTVNEGKKKGKNLGTVNEGTVSEYFENDLIPDSKLLISGKRVNSSVYNQSCEDFAKWLLGKIFVRRQSNGRILKGIIVETESYLGGDDAASKSHKGKRTPGNEPMFMAPGTAYVYFTYGMYHCFNISCEGEGAAALIRAVEPLEGIDEMQRNRLNFLKKMEAKRRAKLGSKTPSNKQKLKDIDKKHLCDGPSKFCISFDIDVATCNKCNLINSKELWLEEINDFGKNIEIISSPRIGIDSAGPIWANKLLRYYILGNDFVSRRNTMKVNKKS